LSESSFFYLELEKAFLTETTLDLASELCYFLLFYI